MAKANPPTMLYEDFTGRTPEGFDRVLAYIPKLYLGAVRLTGDPVLAQDLVQEALSRACKFFNTCKGEYIETWVGKILLNTVREHYRRRGLPLELVDDERILDILEKDSEEQRNLEATILQRIGLRQELEAALGSVPEDYRVPLILLAHEYIPSEIAQEMGLSRPAIKSRIHRGKLLLRERLGHLNDLL